MLYSRFIKFQQINVKKQDSRTSGHKLKLFKHSIVIHATSLLCFGYHCSDILYRVACVQMALWRALSPWSLVQPCNVHYKVSRAFSSYVDVAFDELSSKCHVAVIVCVCLSVLSYTLSYTLFTLSKIQHDFATGQVS